MGTLFKDLNGVFFRFNLKTSKVKNQFNPTRPQLIEIDVFDSFNSIPSFEKKNILICKMLDINRIKLTYKKSKKKAEMVLGTDLNSRIFTYDVEC